jgi:ATP-dependent Lhr-like helicase
LTTTELRAALGRAWAPFFSRFGRLTPVQEAAMPRILAGENAVVISPAASGKTEAVVAPTVARLLSGGTAGLRVLYVSPTRALVNDLYRRLAGPFEQLGLGLGRKTGDHPTIDERKLPFLLITTPESFDSLLCRHPRIFKELGAVVLDELHLLDNTPRGDQLRVLLERLRLINPAARCCALSATIDDLDIGSRYFPDPVVVQVPGRREIDVLLRPLADDWPGEVISELARRDCRKVLCFFNARSAAEAAVKDLDRPPFAGRTRVHHASLNRAVRESVEEQMNRERSGLLCCTSTLELGIDIGDVDAVVLVRPPFNVSSLLQRLGRGNRRRQSYLFVIGLFAGEWERFLFEAMFDCARAGRLYEKRYTPSLSVIPQQLLSYAFQRRRVGMTLDSAARVLAPLAGRAVVEQSFRQLAETDRLEERERGIYVTGMAVEREVESGKVHSNIQEKSFGSYEVVEAASNRRLGTVFFVFHHFVLGGRAWELVERREKEKRLLVRPLDAVTSQTKVFEGTGTGGYSYRFAPVLKARLFPELAEDEFPYFREGRETVLVHLLGATGGWLISEALAARGRDVRDMDGRLFHFESPGPARPLRSFPVPDYTAVRDIVGVSISRLEDGLGSGAFFRLLPPELQVEDHLLALDIDGLLTFLRGLSVVELPPERVTAAIRRRLGAASAPNDRG